MAWRIVKQPNGNLARFSDIVDDFTTMNMTETEAFDLCRIHLGIKDAKRKVRAGLEDWKPWTIGVKGNGTERWEDCLDTVRTMHGEESAEELRLIGTAAREPVAESEEKMDWEIYFENPTSRFDQFVDEEKTIIRADTKEDACAIVHANLLG